MLSSRIRQNEDSDRIESGVEISQNEETDENFSDSEVAEALEASNIEKNIGSDPTSDFETDQAKESESDHPNSKSDQIITENSKFSETPQKEDSSLVQKSILQNSENFLENEDEPEILQSPTEEALEDLLSIIPQLHKGKGELKTLEFDETQDWL